VGERYQLKDIALAVMAASQSGCWHEGNDGSLFAHVQALFNVSPITGQRSQGMTTKKVGAV
jgi:hypothetical protein